MDQITIIIKTFNRKKSLLRLLKSIQNSCYNSLPIIILDDSKKDYKKEVVSLFSSLDINYIVTEFDIGLSEGRNRLIREVKTRFFLLCDDDFVFDSRTDLNSAYDLIMQNKCDILGGITYSKYEVNSVFSLLTMLKHPIRFITKEIPEINNGTIEINDVNNIVIKFNRIVDNYIDNNIYEVDICMNFFLANTERILEIKGWQPSSIKVGEHKAFFIRAKQFGLKVMYTHKLGVLHYPIKTLDYQRYRLRSYNFSEKSFRDLNYNSVLVYNESNHLEYEFKK